MNSSSNESSQTRPSAAAPRRAAIVFIFVTVLLDVLSLGVMIPVLPMLIEGMVFQEQAPAELAATVGSPENAAKVIAARRKAEDDGSDVQTRLVSDFALSSESAQQIRKLSLTQITAIASVYTGLFGTVWALMQFLFSPLLGALSDRFGRRRVILLSCFGLGLDYILMALAPNLIWLFLGRVISGVTAASFATAGAYIADVTPPEKRAASYGLFGAAWSIGFVIGPAMGGLLGIFNLRLALWVAAVLTLLNAAYGYFILPESLPEENRSQFSLRKANPLGSLKLLRSHPDLLGLAAVLLIYQLAHQVFPSVFVLYAGHRYGWGSGTVGITLMVVGLFGGFMQGFVVRRTASALGEWRMVFIALVFGAFGYTIYGMANSGWLFWSAIPVFSLVGFFSAGMQGLMTQRVGPSEQGQLQGANSSLMGIAGMAGPVVFTSIFSFGISNETAVYLPGAPFLLATVLHVLALLLTVLVMRKSGRVSSKQQ